MLASRSRRNDPKKTDEAYPPSALASVARSVCSWLAKRLWIAAIVVLLLTAIASICLTLSFREWEIVPPQCELRDYSWREDAPPTPRYHGPPAEFPDRFTIIINSYKRPQLLQRAVAHYAQCKNVDALRVVWCEDGMPPNRAEAPGYYSDIKEVRYDLVSNSSLNMRFWPLEGLRTEAVLSIDDDIVAPCAVLDKMFAVWRRDPHNMAGFYPRLHVLDQECRFRYLQGFGTLWWHKQYSLVLTKAAMLHRDFLEYYTNHMDYRIREHVDDVHNCEDLAMSLLVGSTTRRPPAVVADGGVRDLGKGVFKVKGISSGAKHGQTRDACLNFFAQFYNYTLPLTISKLAYSAP